MGINLGSFVKKRLLMKIDYFSCLAWLRRHWKTLILFDILACAIAGIYLFITPPIYEANFAVSVPKIQKKDVTLDSAPQWRLMVSSLDFMRGLQNPLSYSEGFIAGCMGQDSNANRKQLVKSLQMGLMNNGDVIRFTLRLPLKEPTAHCAILLQDLVLTQLTQVYEETIAKVGAQATLDNAAPSTKFEKPGIAQSIRLSDSFIYPQIAKVFMFALILGFCVGVFVILARVKYRV